MNDDINVRIKELRKKKGYTQAQLANKIGYTDKAISKWESGEGKPDISVLVKLANLFDVSTDYLLSGEEKEPIYIPISKMELCCKNDDDKLFRELPNGYIEAKDDKENTLFDYIDKYNSVKVFDEFLKTYRPSNLVSSRYEKVFDKKIIYKLLIKYNKLDELENLDFFAEPVKERDNYYYNEQKLTIFDDKIIEYFIEDVVYPSDLFNKAFTMHVNRMLNNERSSWQYLYSKAIYYSIKFEREEITKKLIDLILSINRESLSNYRSKEKENRASKTSWGYNNVVVYSYLVKEKLDNNYRSYNSSYSYAVVSLSKESLEALLSKGYIEEAKEFNEVKILLNDDPLENTLIKCYEDSNNHLINNDDAYICSCVKNGIIDINKLIKYNKYRVIRKALYAYPINREELLSKLFDNKDYKSLLEYAIDNNIEYLKSYIMNGGYLLDNNFDNVIKHCINDNYNDINYNYFKGNSVEYKSSDYNEVKSKVLYDLLKKLPKDEYSDEIKDTLLEYLESNNIDMLIINLYKEIEKILNNLGIVDGIFKEKLGVLFENKFPDLKYLEKDFIKLGLRRNSIVHPEKSDLNLEFSVDKLKSFINLICDMTKEVEHE